MTTLFQVVRAAEECAATLASYIPPAQSIRILIPIIQTSMFPINLAAIKMQTKVVELMAAPALTPLLDELMPGLLKVRTIVNKNEYLVTRAKCHFERLPMSITLYEVAHLISYLSY